MCAASPTLTEPLGSSVGPLVIAPQSGLEQRLAALLASVMIAACLKRSCTLIHELPSDPGHKRTVKGAYVTFKCVNAIPLHASLLVELVRADDGELFARAS